MCLHVIACHPQIQSDISSAQVSMISGLQASFTLQPHLNNAVMNVSNAVDDAQDQVGMTLARCVLSWSVMSIRSVLATSTAEINSETKHNQQCQCASEHILWSWATATALNHTLPPPLPCICLPDLYQRAYFGHTLQ